MARAFTGGQRTAMQAAHVTHSLKLEIEDPDGAYADVSALGVDFLTNFQLEEDIDSLCMTMTATLLRDTGIASLLSLAPLREDSTLNVDSGLAYAPFLDLARKWRASVSVVAYGSAPSYEYIGEGLIDTVTVNDPEPTISLTGRCFGAMLLDRWIETERTYSAGGTDSMEAVIQEILDDNGLTGITLYTPVSPSFVMNPWKQQKENVMAAVNAVANLNGFTVRYRYDASDVFRLTLYAPNRTATPGSELWTLGPEEYTALPTGQLDLSGVRNRIIVRYFNDGTDLETTHTEDDALSIARYGGPEGEPHILEIDLARETNVTTAARVNTFAEAVLRDLKDPPFKQRFEVPGFWCVQLSDYGKFLANGSLYDTDQYGGVTRISHEFENGEYRVGLSVGGQPSARYRGWLTEALRRRTDLAESSGTLAPLEDGGVAGALNGADYVGSHRYATSTSAFPTLATVRSSGTTLNGRQGTFSLGAGTLSLGQSLYMTAIPYSLADALGFEGPSVQLRATRDAGPAMDVIGTPGSTSFTITYTVTADSFQYSIDGGAYASVPGSGFTVSRNAVGGADKVLTFRAVRAGKTITSMITVPAQKLGSLTLTLNNPLFSAGSDTLDVTWSSSGMPAGTTFNVSYKQNGSDGTAGFSDGATSTHQFTGVTGATGSGSVQVDAVYDGNIIASKTRAGTWAT